MVIPYCVYIVSPFFFIFDKKLYLQSISKIKKYSLRKRKLQNLEIHQFISELAIRELNKILWYILLHIKKTILHTLFWLSKLPKVFNVSLGRNLMILCTKTFLVMLLGGSTLIFFFRTFNTQLPKSVSDHFGAFDINRLILEIFKSFCVLMVFRQSIY